MRLRLQRFGSRIGSRIGSSVRFLPGDRERVNLRHRDLDADAGKAQGGILAADRFEVPGTVGRKAIEMQGVFVLIDLDDLAENLDSLQVTALPVALSPLPQL